MYWLCGRVPFAQAHHAYFLHAHHALSQSPLICHLSIGYSADSTLPVSVVSPGVCQLQTTTHNIN